MPTAEEYRRVATHLREKAMAEVSRIIRAEFIVAAVRYDQMAEAIDERSHKRPSKR